MFENIVFLIGIMTFPCIVLIDGLRQQNEAIWLLSLGIVISTFSLVFSMIHPGDANWAVIPFAFTYVVAWLVRASIKRPHAAISGWIQGSGRMASIIGVGLIGVFCYAVINRYQVFKSSTDAPMLLDKWTGKTTRIR